MNTNPELIDMAKAHYESRFPEFPNAWEEWADDETRAREISAMQAAVLLMKHPPHTFECPVNAW